MILVDKLKQFLKETGMTREEFAKKADVPISTLNTLLSKDDPNPTYLTTIKVARAAHISLDEIGGIISNDMGNEEIERIKKAYAQNEESIKKTLDEYASQIAHKEETEAHNKETIRRQDLRMDALNDRVAYQKKAIFWLRLFIGLLAAYSVLVTVALVTVLPAIMKMI